MGDFGKDSTIVNRCGRLKSANRDEQCFATSLEFSEACRESSTIAAHTTSPKTLSGIPNTAHSSISGRSSSTASTSLEYTFSPPTMMISDKRSTILTEPLASTVATSPTVCHFPSKVPITVGPRTSTSPLVTSFHSTDSILVESLTTQTSKRGIAWPARASDSMDDEGAPSVVQILPQASVAP